MEVVPRLRQAQPERTGVAPRLLRAQPERVAGAASRRVATAGSAPLLVRTEVVEVLRSARLGFDKLSPNEGGWRPSFYRRIPHG